METAGNNPEVIDDTGRDRTAERNKKIYSRIWWFSLLYNLTNMVTSIQTTYIRSQITTLEKQFGFNSKQLGLIVSSTELGFLLYATCVCCSSCKVHIPRILGLSTVLFGISCLLCSAPHFLYGVKNSILGSETNETNQINAVCSDHVPSLSCNSGAGDKSSLADEVTLVSLGILVLGKIVQGLVQSPRSVLFCNYVTGMQERELLVVAFVALLMTSVISHPLGYVLGGLFSQIYVTLQDTPWTMTHPQWIGAWWLGLVMFGAVSLLLALPMFCYPRDLPTVEVAEQDAHEGQGSLDKNAGLVNTLSGKKCSIESTTPRQTGQRDVPPQQGFCESLCRLLTTPVYLCMTISACCMGFSTSGSSTFTPKYLETMFNYPTFKTNNALGCMFFVGPFLGLIVTSYTSRDDKVTVLRELKLCLVVTAFAFGAVCTGFFLQCKQPTIYNWPMESRQCYEDCHCQRDSYMVVCGDNDLTYYSPCTAGCTSEMEGTFRNCSCTPSGNANSGTCKYGCGQLYLYVFFLGVRAFFLSLTIVPTLVVNIWCSRKENKALAVELYSLLFSIAGSIGPVAFGHMIDETCLIWDHHCGVKGRCLLYDHKQLQLWFHAYSSVPIAMSLVFLVMAYTLCRWNSDSEYKQYRKYPKVIATINVAIIKYKYENDTLGTPV